MSGLPFDHLSLAEIAECMMGNLSRNEFDKKLKHETIECQEPSYASGPRGGGTYASGGHKIVEVWFDGALVATKRISFNPMFENSDTAKLAAVSKELWWKHGDRAAECDYEEYLPPHDRPCGRPAEVSLTTKDGYELYFCGLHPSRGRNAAISNRVCDADATMIVLSSKEQWRPPPLPKGTPNGDNWISLPRPRTTNPSDADFDYIAAGYTIEEYCHSGPTPRGGFTRYCARIKWQDEVIWDGEWYTGGYRSRVLQHARERSAR